MRKQPQKSRPRLIRVSDVRGDDLIPPRLVQELLDADDRMFPRLGALARTLVKAGDRPAQTVAEELAALKDRPWDAPMATPLECKDDGWCLDRVLRSPAIWSVALALVVSFFSGFLIGRWS